MTKIDDFVKNYMAITVPIKTQTTKTKDASYECYYCEPPVEKPVEQNSVAWWKGLFDIVYDPSGPTAFERLNNQLVRLDCNTDIEKLKQQSKSLNNVTFKGVKLSN